MKDALKRAAQAVGLIPAPVAAVVENVAPEAAVEAVEAVAEVVAEAVADVVDVVVPEASNEALTTLQAAFDAQASQLATALAELDNVKAALAAITQTAEQAAAAAHVAEMAARKELVIAALGTERADAFMVVAETMDKATFTSVMAAMDAKAVVEADTPEFKEVGVDAQADVDALVAEADHSGTGAILKAKYQQNVAN